METFELKVMASNRVFFKGKCRRLVFRATDGLQTILPHHEDSLIAVDIGEIRLQQETGDELLAIVGPGFMEVEDNCATLLVHTAELPEEIDLNRALEAKERAEERLRHKQNIQQYNHTQASLSRALVRLNAKSVRR